MKCDHLPREQLEFYVLDMLDADDKVRVERHVVVCVDCASALAAEARAELDLQALVAGSKRHAERGSRHVGSEVLARPLARRAREQRWSGAARTSMSAVTLVVLVWSLGSARLDTRYVPSRVPQGAELISSLPESSTEPTPSCEGEIEIEEPLCRLASTGGASLELAPSPAIESRLVDSCAQPTADVCRSDDPAL